MSFSLLGGRAARSAELRVDGSVMARGMLLISREVLRRGFWGGIWDVGCEGRVCQVLESRDQRVGGVA